MNDLALGHFLHAYAGALDDLLRGDRRVGVWQIGLDLHVAGFAVQRGFTRLAQGADTDGQLLRQAEQGVAMPDGAARVVKQIFRGENRAGKWTPSEPWEAFA